MNKSGLQFWLCALVGMTMLGVSGGTWAQKAHSQKLDFSGVPEIVSGQPLQVGATYRFTNIAPGYDAAVTVQQMHRVRLLSIDENTQFRQALRPVILAATDGAYAEFVVQISTRGGDEVRPVDVQASLVEFVNKVASLYRVSDYTLEADSTLLVVDEPDGTVHLTTQQGTPELTGIQPNSAVSVIIGQDQKLVVRVTAKRAGLVHGSILFEPIDFADPMVLNVNDTPVATDDNNVVFKNERIDVSAEFGLLSNDIDADIPQWGDSLAVDSFAIDSVVFHPDSTVSTTEGSITIQSSGAYEFIPAVNFTGVVRAIEYRVVDSYGAYDNATLTLVALNNKRMAAGITTIELQIDEDVNRDGYINRQELKGRIDIAVDLPDDALVGENLEINSQYESISTTIDPLNLSVGRILASFDAPADGEVLEITALYRDENGQVLAQVVDQVKLDLVASEKPEIEIVADTDNSGFLSSSEYKSELIVRIHLPTNSAVNDRISLTYGNEQHSVVLTPVDIAEQSVSVVVPVVAEGQTFSLTASITDEAGNTSETSSDSVQVDTTPPALPEVFSLQTISPTPTLVGEMPDDKDYLLSVAVSGITYVAGDGHLRKLPSGQWELVIPAADPLAHGVYDVVATVTDIAGNSSTDITTGELSLDLQAPDISVENVGLSSDAAPLIRGETDQSDAEVVVVGTQAGTSLCVAMVFEGSWACRVRRVLNIGENKLVASAIDDVGNEVRLPFEVKVVQAADSDGDGITDDIEGTDDSDHDGVADYTDLDSDNDGIADLYESMLDTDSDGVRDYRDTDSDGDGISDIIEAGFSPVEGSAVVDENGIVSQLNIGGATPGMVEPPDSDADLVDDYRDLDSDNDGISDAIEKGLTADGGTQGVLDTDADNVPDYLDLDSDQDGVSDISEQLVSDVDGDGRVDGFSDLNVDGVSDTVELSVAIDTDSDGIANVVDLDSDGDSRSDLIESGGIDVDNDGILDELRDRNFNGIADSVDQLYTGGVDSDGDAIDDRYDVDFAGGEDSDADGIVDAFDMDADGNGILDRRQSATESGNLSDVYEFEPVASAVLSTGTGTLGGGCSMVHDDNGNSMPRVDWSLTLLLLSTLFGAMRRRQVFK